MEITHMANQTKEQREALNAALRDELDQVERSIPGYQDLSERADRMGDESAAFGWKMRAEHRQARAAHIRELLGEKTPAAKVTRTRGAAAETRAD